MRYPSPGSTHSASVTDAALFVAEDFIGDLEKVVDHVFIQASMNTPFKQTSKPGPSFDFSHHFPSNSLPPYFLTH